MRSRSCPGVPRGLWTDLYELTMARGYIELEQNNQATFDLFVRRLPGDRSFLVSAGLETAAEFLREMAFSEEDIRYLRRLPQFEGAPRSFWNALRDFRFTGDVDAIPEGTIAFPGEPILTVTAPIAEAQVAETSLISIVAFQTMVATKAERIARAAAGRPVVDFGARRAHGMQAGLYAARAAYIGGCVGTSHVEAGRRFGIPVFGTVAHSWIQNFESELQAFQAYCRLYPEGPVLLIDTYHSLEGAENAIRATENLKAVRIDSGDLAETAKSVRRILDKSGREHVQIILSGDLNEFKIEELLRKEVPVDSFGVGTEMVTSIDFPSLSMVYKLSETRDPDGRVRGRAKLSPGKETWPGRKQVFRRFRDGRIVSDRIGLVHESPVPGEQALLRPLMRNGRRVGSGDSLEAVREHVRSQVSALPRSLMRLSGSGRFRVRPTRRLSALARKVRREVESS